MHKYSPEAIPIATDTSPTQIAARVHALRDNEPDPFSSTADAVEAYIREVRDVLALVDSAGDASLTEAHQHYLHDASAREVRFAHARLERDRTAALEILSRLFRLGTPPSPDGRYDGELVGLSTGLLSDPFFEWMTRLYLPWLGKSFDRASQTGDNVFSDNAWSKATGKLGWPEYREPTDLPNAVRVFPFRTFIGRGIEDPDIDVLKIHYADSPNPLPVRRIEDEVVELPGGYILGKAHMRGLREFRRICFFALVRAGSN